MRRTSTARDRSSRDHASGDPGSWNPLAVALDLVLPRPCPGCGRPEQWCSACASALAGRPRLVRLPEETVDASVGAALPPVWAIARYAGPVRAAVLSGKEHGRTDLPGFLGVAMGRALVRLRRIALIPDRVWIVPAPSRRSAARRRGGDPVTAMARLAARVLAEHGTEAGVCPCLYTAGQARDSVGLNATQRAANLAGRIRSASGRLLRPEMPWCSWTMW